MSFKYSNDIKILAEICNCYGVNRLSKVVFFPSN